MEIFAIDPGNEQSAFVIWDGTCIKEKGIIPNEDLLFRLTHQFRHIVIEMVASYGMPVGATVFNTCVWIGRFIQAVNGNATLIYRKDVKMFLCGSMRAKDSNIRQRLIDLYEPNLKPRQRPKGVLKGLKADEWAALSIAVTYMGEFTS